MTRIEVKVAIYPINVLSALVGNPQPSCWATEVAGYRVQQNEKLGDDWQCFKSREVSTYEDARRLAKSWESSARAQGYTVHAMPRFAV